MNEFCLWTMNSNNIILTFKPLYVYFNLYKYSLDYICIMGLTNVVYDIIDNFLFIIMISLMKSDPMFIWIL
jgi:hypothetical protein